MSTNAFVTHPSLAARSLRRSSSNSFESFKSTCPKRPKPSHQLPKMLFMEPIHTIPELMSQLVVSCGIGIAGIVGAKATEEVRAMASSERRADYMDALSVDIDSYRRRKELADAAGNRDWGDVDVDRFSNVVVTPDHVPALDSHDDLQAFDRMLMNAPAAQREKEQMLKQALPEPSEFVFSDDDGDHDQS